MSKLRTLSLLASALLALSTLAGCPQFPAQSNNDGGPDAGNVDAGPQETRECKAIVLFNGGESAQKVTISGEFNDWDETATPLERHQGAWRTELELSPGHYGYKFVVDGVYEGEPPPDQYTKWVGQFENRALIVPNCNVPSWKVVESRVSASGLVTATLKFQSAASGKLIDPISVRVTVGNVSVEPELTASTGTLKISYQAPEHGKYTIKARAADTDGVLAENSPLWLPLWWEATEFSWQDSIMYLIFTDRFRDSDGTSPVPPVQDVPQISNYMGGDFKGITDALEDGYFDKMGVNLLWLSPINENTDIGHRGSDPNNKYTGYHGYWTVDALRAETRYGDADADGDARLHELVRAAQKRGVRVMFDLVLNHVHEDHQYCDERPDWCALTCTCGEAGCAWEGPGGRPLDCQFAPYLPDLNYRNHDILRRVVDDVLLLMKKFDVDSIRIDAAKHMDHIIMRTIRLRLNELEAMGATPFYVVGETYVGDDGHDLIMDYVADYELHGQFDFPLLGPIRHVFGGDGSFKHLEARTALSEQKYHSTLKWHSPFLGNHDIPRFVSVSQGNVGHPFGGTPDLMGEGPQNEINQWNIINRMSMGFAFLLTIPGIPLIYYGDEVGLAGGPDPDNRRMMPWEWNANQRELLERVRTLGKARRAIRPLRHGSRQELWIDDDFYVYARDAGSGDVAIVAMNKGGEQREVMVTIPAGLQLTGKTLNSVNSTRQVTVAEGQIRVTLDSWEYAVFYGN
ncbi:MAG: hypothetical protein H0U74_05050 [Bradymonadaceae bacterium]|nr:hypothetical protein [Lujinxingiaceae bacterium]